MEFDYKLYPGRKRETIEYENKDKKPVITIITAYYNGHKYIDETINSVLNQTFPFWEWLIVNDGSTDEDSIKKLEEIKTIDKRIKVLNKENGGLAETRDYGASKASESSKYLLFLDDDDLINKTYLECTYIALETNKEATWAYTDLTNFGGQEILWTKYFSSEIEKENNLLVATALIRKSDFWNVNGYELREKAVNEDWNLWLKLLGKGKFPVRLDFYGFWYRKKPSNESELERSKENYKRAKEIINESAKKITGIVEAIQYPKQDYNWDMLEELNIEKPKRVKDSKKHILLIFPWLALGGADKFNLDFIKGLSNKDYEFTIITTEPNINVWRQQFEEHATIYDLTTFLDRKYWASFINYIIKKDNIDLIFNSNSTFGYAVLPYLKACNPQIPIIDYIHMEEWYNRNGGFSRDTAYLEKVIEKTLVCNENSKEILKNYFGRKEEKIETVYIGVDSKKFDPEKYDKKALFKKYNINTENKKVIGFIARIDVQKRPYLLAKIIKKLNQERNDCIFLIAGDGPLLPKIKKKIKKYKMEDDVIFLGAISNTAEIYAMCDLTLNCSIKEGVALTSYESLSMGVPVVSSDVGGQAELISSEVGEIVPCLQKEEEILDFNYSEEEISNYIQAINKILNNIENYKKNARQRILESFSIHAMIEKMDQILTSLVNDSLKEDSSIGNYKEIFKELVVKYFMLFSDEYQWLCDELNTFNFGTGYKIQEQKDHVEKTHNKFEKLISKLYKTSVKLHIYEEIKILATTIKQIFKCITELLMSIVSFVKVIIMFFIKIIKQFGLRICNLVKKIGGKNE